MIAPLGIYFKIRWPDLDAPNAIPELLERKEYRLAIVIDVPFEIRRVMNLFISKGAKIYVRQEFVAEIENDLFISAYDIIALHQETEPLIP